jgi:hypothetical protein
MKITTIACLVFVALGVNWLSKYGSQWDLSGRYCMPTTLLSPDGHSYRDGSPADGFTLALVDRGIEQEAWLAAAVELPALFGALALRMRRLYRVQQALDRELRRIHGISPDDERG